MPRPCPSPTTASTWSRWPSGCAMCATRMRRWPRSTRVLRPGGRLLVLEFSKPRNPLLARAYDAYSFSVLPRLGQAVADDADSYRYLAESIRRHPDQDTLQGMFGAGRLRAHPGLQPDRRHRRGAPGLQAVTPPRAAAGRAGILAEPAAGAGPACAGAAAGAGRWRGAAADRAGLGAGRVSGRPRAWCWGRPSALARAPQVELQTKAVFALLRDPRAGRAVPGMHVAGDAEYLQRFVEVFQGLEADLAGLLEPWLGEQAAPAAAGLRRVQGFLRRGLSGLEASGRRVSGRGVARPGAGRRAGGLDARGRGTGSGRGTLRGAPAPRGAPGGSRRRAGRLMLRSGSQWLRLWRIWRVLRRHGVDQGLGLARRAPV